MLSHNFHVTVDVLVLDDQPTSVSVRVNNESVERIDEFGVVMWPLMQINERAEWVQIKHGHHALNVNVGVIAQRIEIDVCVSIDGSEATECTFTIDGVVTSAYSYCLLEIAARDEYIDIDFGTHLSDAHVESLMS